MQSCSLSVINSLDVGTVSQENFNNILLTAALGKMQSSPPLEVFSGLDRGSIFKENMGR